MSAGVSQRPALGRADSAASPPRRILLVTGGLGGGHQAAARAVEERARQVWPGVEVAWTDTLDGMGRHTGALFRAVYAGCVRRLPWLYALYFMLLCRVPPFRAATRAVIGRWSAPGLARELARHGPDLVVATFPEGVTGLGRLRERGRLPMPTVALVTDPAPHPLWVDPGLDLHLVSTDEGAARLARTAPDARVRVAALPVSASFHPPDAPLAHERPLVYVSCGSLAFGELDALCAAVLDARADVLVSAGRVPAVRRRLDRLARTRPDGARLRVVDWVDDPAAVTRTCDAVVTNAGGATALEALACARPLLLCAPIPGHGRANAAVLAAAGLATLCPGPPELTAAVRALVDPARRAAASARLRERLAGGDLAADVAALVRLNGPGTRRGPALRAQDALFVHATTGSVPQQVGVRVVVEDPAHRDDWPDYVAELVHSRAAGIALLCRRLPPPRHWRRRRWALDDAPDPLRHVRPGLVEVGPGGDYPSWDDAVTAFLATPVDPGSAAWELQVARERARGDVAVLVRAHHAVGDGLALTDALIRLLTDEPPAAPPGGRAPRRPGRASAAPARLPLAGLRRAATVARGVARLALAGRAGPSPLTGAITGPAHRRVSVCLDGTRVRTAARRHGVGTTVLLLAVVAEAVHGLLAGRRAEGTLGRGTSGTVRAMVPITTRTGGAVGSRAVGNRTAAVAVDLPTVGMSPAARVGRVARAMAHAERGGQAEAAAVVLVLLGLLPGRLQALFVRAVYGRRFFHMLASVMPGARRPLHMRGCLVREAYPVLPLADGVGLAVGALHWGRTTGIGITADPNLVPEWAQLPEHLTAALARVEGDGAP